MLEFDLIIATVIINTFHPTRAHHTSATKVHPLPNGASNSMLTAGVVFVPLPQRWTLGSGGKHVMDSISQCEQEMRRQGQAEGNAPWELSIRKEMFKPWHNCSEDPVSTELIYKQILLSLKAEEYICDKVRPAVPHVEVCVFGGWLNWPHLTLIGLTWPS